METLDRKIVTYDEVNALWPPELPTLDQQTAIKRANAIYKVFWKEETGRRRKTNRFQIYRRKWASTARTRNTENAGWRRMVHDVSHWLLMETSPGLKPHGPVHADIEYRMIQYVLKRGWVAT